MTRRTTLFLVCAFEVALLLFVAAWSARAHECILKDNTATAIMTYNTCKNDLATGNSGHKEPSLFPEQHWIVVQVQPYPDQSDVIVNHIPQRSWETKEKCEDFLRSRVQPGESLTNTGRNYVITYGDELRGYKRCMIVSVTDR